VLVKTGSVYINVKEIDPDIPEDLKKCRLHPNEMQPAFFITDLFSIFSIQSLTSFHRNYQPMS